MAGQIPEHGPGLLLMGRFAQDPAPQSHHRVRAQDDPVRVFPHHGPGLGQGLGRHQIVRRQAGQGVVVVLGRGHDLKGEPGLGEHLPAAGRGGSQNKGS